MSHSNRSDGPSLNSSLFRNLPNLHILDTAKTTADLQDLQVLNAIVGDASIVGLGEVTHGIAECFTLKHLWAHNGHVHKDSYPFAKQETNPIVWMGELLEKKYGKDYRVIGFIAHHGEYTAYSMQQNKIVEDVKLLAPPKESIENCLHELGKPLLLVDLKNNCPDFLKENIVSRIGIGACTETTVEESFGPYKLSAGYDGIIYIDEAHASKLLPLEIVNPKEECKNEFKKGM